MISTNAMRGQYLERSGPMRVQHSAFVRTGIAGGAAGAVATHPPAQVGLVAAVRGGGNPGDRLLGQGSPLLSSRTVETEVATPAIFVIKNQLGHPKPTNSLISAFLLASRWFFMA